MGCGANIEGYVRVPCGAGTGGVEDGLGVTGADGPVVSGALGAAGGFSSLGGCVFGELGSLGSVVAAGETSTWASDGVAGGVESARSLGVSTVTGVSVGGGDGFRGTLAASVDGGCEAGALHSSASTLP